ncbi:hypothetical protein D049_3281B, partial [Vibrio parahaemolyticus VPTS-2010]
INLPHLSMFK